MLRKHKTISDKLFYNGNQNFQLELQSARIVFEVVKIVGYPCELVYICLTVVWLICTYMEMIFWRFRGTLVSFALNIFLLYSMRFFFPSISNIICPKFVSEICSDLSLLCDIETSEFSGSVSFKFILKSPFCACLYETI